MSDSEKYDAIIIGSGKGGKILATYLGKQNHKVTLIERDPMMIGGGCINVACIPTKTFIASARLVHSIRRAAEFGIKVERERKEPGEINRQIGETLEGGDALRWRHARTIAARCLPIQGGAVARESHDLAPPLSPQRQHHR
jgi:pyruvate/2-oxoglutarate dehydrogenase complex dihydrolipoamide dehydrogenase (E3) component